MAYNIMDWIAGCVMIYGSLFGIGKIILKDYVLGIVFLVVGLAAGAVIYRDLSRRGWSSVLE
jgi:SSS family solute:Na+ symporter